MHGRNQYRRPPSGGVYGLTPMVQKLLIANVAVWFAQMFLESSGVPLTALGAVSVAGVFQAGFLWQPATYMWLHGNAMHLLFNMFAPDGRLFEILDKDENVIGVATTQDLVSGRIGG